MRKLRFTTAAADDLQSIWSYIAQHSEAAASRYLRRLDSRMRQLLIAPEIGERQHRYRAGLRSIVEGSYVIFYEVVPDAISIYRLLHGARDLPTILGDDNGGAGT